MNDQEFLHAFETASLDSFPHRSHIRMAWLYLRRDGLERGSQNIVEGIQKFAATMGATTKYHETITRFWAIVVYAALQQTPAEDNFDRFTVAHPHLLNAKLISDFYSPERLKSDAARHAWLEPDLKALPPH